MSEKSKKKKSHEVCLNEKVWSMSEKSKKCEKSHSMSKKSLKYVWVKK